MGEAIWTGDLRSFVVESNRIENIDGATKDHIVAHAALLEVSELTVDTMRAFVLAVQPNAVLRDKPNLNVRVGRHVAPQGGPAVVSALAELLYDAEGGADPYHIHLRYETLHPFTDGNGRSGRALWLWQMKQARHLSYALELGFLRAFYYAALDRTNR